MKKEQMQLIPMDEQEALIRIDVRLPALAQFAKNRLHAFDVLTSGLRESVSKCVSRILETEMSLFLGGVEQANNKRNGHRTREYYLKGVGCLRIQMPRDRDGKFDSVVIPSHERMDVRTREDLGMLHLAGLSNRTLAMISNRLLGVEVSKDTVSKSLEVLKPAAEKWLTRSLEEKKYWALYVDGTNFRIQRRGSTEKEPSLVVLGVDERNRRSILTVEPGNRDNVESWRAVFRDLKRRGLDSEAVRIGIMDGLPGLEKLFKEEFPKAVTQRCWSHAMRNAMAKAPAPENVSGHR